MESKASRSRKMLLCEVWIFACVLVALLTVVPLGSAYGIEGGQSAETVAANNALASEAAEPGETPVESTSSNPQPISLTSAKVSGLEKAYGQTGKPITPAITVTLAGKKLEKGTDYTVSFKNNVKRGTARLIITGQGSYTGTLEKTFKIQYRITYKLNGGTNSKKNPACYAGKSGNKVTAKLAKPKRAGYRFLGWYSDKKLTKKVTAITGKGDKTYYAKWQKVTYQITYKNVSAPGIDNSMNPETYKRRSSAIKLKNPTRVGFYQFEGWYSDKACTQRITAIPKNSTGDIVLYAKWKKGPFNAGDKKVTKQVDKISKKYKSLKSAFEWVTHHSHKNFSSRTYAVGSTSWGLKEAKRFFFSDNKDCYGFAAAFYYLALHKGYDAKLVSGHVPRLGGGKAPHGWVEIKIKGITYVCDPDLQRQYPAYNFYLVTYGNAPVTYYKS